MYETAHARTHGVEEEYLSLKGAMGNARLSGRAVGHDGRSCSVLSSRKDRVCLLDREKESPFGAVWFYHTEFPIEFPKSESAKFFSQLCQFPNILSAVCAQLIEFFLYSAFRICSWSDTLWNTK